ncbi:hypothetical protein [Streptomyces sp. TBY4]|uniref:hypothetical protein n=1 Tax=Streptomyces sp. TBY4 TaxID=2962030 RepID=UPI0020B778DA|nr:hypothetical protein [Streptomyces sp. TBY4]MCP3755791.1 hypothetical protein [Streptomyces sp. TBY4]
MKPTEKALKNGWGWVIGVSGQDSRVYSRPAQQPPAVEPAEVLGRAAKLLGLEDLDLVPARIQHLQDCHKQALASAETAWRAVHTATRVTWR